GADRSGRHDSQAPVRDCDRTHAVRCRHRRRSRVRRIADAECRWESAAVVEGVLLTARATATANPRATATANPRATATATATMSARDLLACRWHPRLMQSIPYCTNATRTGQPS